MRTAASVKERPILFRGPMVRAILADDKTQTRRLVKPQPDGRTEEVLWNTANEAFVPWRSFGNHGWERNGTPLNCPYGAPGDRLWVRETHGLAKPVSQIAMTADATYCCFPDGSQVFKEGGYYQQHTPVTGKWPTGWRWRPSIHMPRWASRLNLHITALRVERLHEITEADALAEGVNTWAAGAMSSDGQRDFSAVEKFELMWKSSNGEAAWDVNPWVWVVVFERIAAETPT